MTVEEFETPWVGVAARILVDPADEHDVATVNALLALFTTRESRRASVSWVRVFG